MTRSPEPGLLARNRAKTHCPQGHPYNEENTRTTNGKRYCRACDREHKRAAAARAKVKKTRTRGPFGL